MSGHADTIRVYRHDVPGSGPYSVASIEVVKTSDYDALVTENQQQAQEIERLRDRAVCSGGHRMSASLEAENERLRKALTEIVELLSTAVVSVQRTRALEVARAATSCPACGGRREVAATPGHPEDGPMPCPSCTLAGTPSEDTG